MLAMNRLRHAYLEIEPGLERYLTTGHHDDERGVLATYMLDRPTRQSLGAGFALVNTPTIVATVDAALAAAIVVLLLQVAEAPRAVAVAGGWWRSWPSGGCCFACSCTPCARSAARRRGSPPRRTYPDVGRYPTVALLPRQQREGRFGGCEHTSARLITKDRRSLLSGPYVRLCYPP